MELTLPVNRETSLQKIDISQKKFLIALFSASLAIVSSYFIYEHLTWISTDNAQIQAKTVLLAPKVSGYITKMNVEENQKVRSGEVLAEIDPQDYHNTLLQIENEMGSIEAKTQNAEKEFKRVSSLFRKGVVSQQQYDTSETTWKELTRKLNSFHSQVSQARLNLSYTQIKAPSEGVVAKKVAEQGMLAPIGTPLFGFVSSEGRWVVANFKETQLLQIKPGKQVEVKVDAIPNQTFFGIVESISPSTGATFALLPPDNASGNFTKVIQRVPVRIKLINLSAENIDQLQVGLSASVFVKIRS